MHRQSNLTGDITMSPPTRLFLSYASEDFESVNKLYARLQNAGYDPWMDKRNILPGERWEQSIWRAIKRSELFIVILTHRSVNKRGFLQREIRRALSIWQEKFEDDIYIIPARVENCDAPDSLSEFEWVDLFAGDGFDRLCEAIDEGTRRLRHGEEKLKAASGINIRNVQLFDSNELPPTYDISVEFPQLDSFEAALSEVNTCIHSLILNEVHDARSVVFSETVNIDDTPIVPSVALEGTSQITFASSEIISVAFDFYSYRKPSAHPNFWRRALTLSLSPVAKLAIDDVFDYDTNYIPQLTELCDIEIKKEFGGEFGLSTFSPTHEGWERYDSSRFKLFNVLPSGLSFSFVGPFVVKIAHVTLPYSVLRPYLSHRTPIWQLASEG